MNAIETGEALEWVEREDEEDVTNVEFGEVRLCWLSAAALVLYKGLRPFTVNSSGSSIIDLASRY